MTNTTMTDQGSEQMYHRMVEEVEDYAILLLSRGGIIKNWNKGAEKIKGYTEQEIVGQHFRIFYLPEDQQRYLPEQLLNTAIHKGKAMHEGWRVRKDKTVFWGSIVITALHDNNNNIIGFSKVTRDLTERKNAEDKIKEDAARLALQNRELEQFAYIAAHDLKEPLRKILLYNNYVLKQAGNKLPAKEKKFLGQSVDTVIRMQSLIDDLLSYSKMIAGDEQLESVDLNAVLKEVESIHDETITQTAAGIEANNLPVIKAVPFQVTQLFDNLIGNALKYHHPGRKPCIKITCEIVQGVTMDGRTISPKKHFYKIRFEDNGIGFEATYAEKIFDLFQRLHNRQEYPGTGIGLAICKKIMQNHKGYIQAAGHVNEGASFTVYFPV